MIKSTYKGILCYPFTDPMIYRGMIGWYKVDEGSGTILYNSAPASASKLPDLNIVTPGSNFWGLYSGFGYWDGVATRTYKIFSFDPLGTGPRTVMIFGREKHGLQDTKIATQYYLAPTDPEVFDYYSALGGIVVVKQPNWAGMSISLTPGSDYYDRPFVSVYTLTDVFLSTLQIKYTGGTWKSTTPSTYNPGPGLTDIYIGGRSSPPYIWKGILGDFMIFNVLLTTAEIDQIVSSRHSRWNI